MAVVTGCFPILHLSGFRNDGAVNHDGNPKERNVNVF